MLMMMILTINSQRFQLKERQARAAQAMLGPLRPCFPSQTYQMPVYSNHQRQLNNNRKGQKY